MVASSRRILTKRTIFAATVVGAAAALAAGSAMAFGGSATNPEAFLPNGTDGPVTQEVYQEAFAEFRDCMKQGGADLVGERIVGKVYEFSYLADKAPVYDRCYVDFAAIDFQWQVAHSYESPTYVRLRECLADIGIEPGKDADTVWAQVQDSRIDVRECTSGVQ